jgi:hypothetical protein
MRLTRILIVVALALLFVPSVAAQGAVTLTAQAGFDAYYKEGYWTPIRVALNNVGNDLNGQLRVVAVRANGSKLEYIYPVPLANGARKEVTMYINVEGFANRLQVDYVQDQKAIASVTPRLSQLGSNDMLYGVIASNASAFNYLGRVDPVGGRGRVAQLSIQDLPAAGHAWRTLDALVIADVDTSVLTPAQKDSLKLWLASGGRLIVASGPNWQKLAGLDDILPMKIIGTRDSPLASLESFAQKKSPSGSAVVAMGDLKPGAIPLIADNNVPLIVDQPYGFGHIALFTFDPTLDPIRNWDGMENIYRNLLASASDRPGWMGFARNWASAVEAVSSIPGIGLPHPLVICGFLSAYLIIIGPLNYIILRGIKRREFAWLTIPVTVVFFTVAIYITGTALRGTRPTIHRLSIVQSWEDSTQAHVETLLGVFSPTRSEYDLRVTGDALLQPMPSDTYYRPLDRSFEGVQIEQGDAALARGVKVDIGAVTPFFARGQVTAPRFSSSLKYSVTGNVVTLEGVIVNKSEITFRDAVVITMGGVQRVGDVKPNDTVNVRITLAADRSTWVSQGRGRVFPAGSRLAPQYNATTYPGYDTTVEDILGTVAYSDSRETYRRYSLLSWLFAYNAGGRGSGTYLIGWTDKSPLDASLTNSSYSVQDQTMYLMRVEPQVVVVNATTITIPPGLMTWEIIDPGPTGNNASPYDSRLSGGYFSLRFKPAVRLDFNSVKSLVLHLTSYGATGAPPLTLSLWDRDANLWVKIDNIVWGDNTIGDAARYVSDDGRIDVKVDSLRAQTPANIQAMDFTLTVQR